MSGARSTDTASRSRFTKQRAERFSVLAGVAVAAVGVAVLLGWVFDVVALKQVAPGFVSMKANTAVGLLSCGVALALALARRPEPLPSAVATALLALAAAIGTLTLAEFVFSVDLRIDTLLFADGEPEPLRPFPGRPSSVTAIEFMVLAAGLWLCRSGAGRTFAVGQACLVLALLVSTMLVSGYLYGSPALYEVGPYSAVALHTAIAFLLLTAGGIAANPARGVCAVLLSPAAGGTMLRRIVVPAVAIPLVFGWFQLELETGEVLGVESGAAALASVLAASSVMLLWLTAWSLNRMDDRRSAAEDAREQLRAMFLNMRDGILLVRRGGEIVDANPAAAKISGRPKELLEGLNLSRFAEAADSPWSHVAVPSTGSTGLFPRTPVGSARWRGPAGGCEHRS